MASTEHAEDWRHVAARKRESVLNLIPQDWRIDVGSLAIKDDTDLSGSYLDQFLSPEEVTITNTDPCTIVENTGSGKWRSIDVARAFAHRAALAHQLLPCLHEIGFEDAFSEAQRLDEFYEANKRPIGPLHGLPVSLKDQFHVRGLDTSMGYVGWLGTFEGVKGTGKERVFESVLVKELRALGAIIYCKTSVPQTLMAGETFNNIIGELMNPRNRKVSSGGSSGGEGVLIAMKGSPLGMGTDIGGSVRIPAAFNGLYGIRTSIGRIPYEGAANSMKGQISARSTIGPLAHTISGLRLAIKSVLSQNPWQHDPLVHEVPWRDEQEELIRQKAKKLNGKKLTFGLLLDDGVARPFPSIQRALLIVKEKLEEEGHKVIPWSSPLHFQSAQKLFGTWVFDGGEDVHRAFSLSGEDIGHPLQVLPWGKHTIPPMTGGQIADWNIEHTDLRKQYLDMWMASASETGTGEPIDAVISPATANHAATPAMYVHLTYNFWPNFHDLPSCYMTVTMSDKTVDRYDQNAPSLGPMDDKVRATYDPELFDRLPVGVQIVGRRLEEEKVLAISQYISELLPKPT